MSKINGYQSILPSGEVIWRNAGETKEYPIFKEDLWYYWSFPNEENNITDYINCSERSLKLIDYFKKYISTTSSILELGCNMGRNLHYLYEAGYKNLTGIDINNKALNLCREKYPELKGIPLVGGEVNRVLRQYLNDSFNVIFTMAVLEHIHPQQISILAADMARVVVDYIIICEDEKAVNWRAFSYRYKNLFEHLGLKELEMSTLDWKNDIDKTGDCTLTYRIFKK